MKIGDLVKLNPVVIENGPHTGIIVDLHHPWANPKGLGDGGMVKVFWDDEYITWTNRERIEVISEGG